MIVYLDVLVTINYFWPTIHVCFCVRRISKAARITTQKGARISEVIYLRIVTGILWAYHIELHFPPILAAYIVSRRVA